MLITTNMLQSYRNTMQQTDYYKIALLGEVHGEPSSQSPLVKEVGWAKVQKAIIIAQ